MKSILKHMVIALLLSGITLPQEWLHELMKAPALIMHYVHHATEHNQAGFIEFISMHYGDSEHMSTDAHEHENLPGADHQNQCQHLQIIPAFISNTTITLSIPQLFVQPAMPVYQAFFSNTVSNAIWQPPKQA